MFLSVVTDCIGLYNQDFLQAYERHYALPIGQMKAQFAEVNALVKVYPPPRLIHALFSSLFFSSLSFFCIGFYIEERPFAQGLCSLPKENGYSHVFKNEGGLYLPSS